MGANITSSHVILGNADIIELKPSRAWTRADGITTVRRIVGPQEAIRNHFNELAADADNGADEIVETLDAVKGVLEIRIAEDSGGAAGGNTEELNVVWELRSNRMTKPIETRREFDELTALKKRSIEKAAREAEANPETGAAATKLYAYYANQVLECPATDLELTKSISVSRRSTLAGVYTNLNRVVAIASIEPPTDLLGALNAIPLADGSAGSWEWMYLGPQIRQVTQTKYQISYSWHGAERWAQIYGGTWNPEA